MDINVPDGYRVAPDGDPRFLYVYGTGDRPDGYRFAVGTVWGDPVKTDRGGRALFRHANDAQVFAYAIQAQTGCAVHILPSAEVSE